MSEALSVLHVDDELAKRVVQDAVVEPRVDHVEVGTTALHPERQHQAELKTHSHVTSCRGRGDSTSPTAAAPG